MHIRIKKASGRNLIRLTCQYKYMKSYVWLILGIMCIIFVSGCTGASPESLALNNPLVQQFLEDYPDAEIHVNFFTAEQSAQILDNITAECGSLFIEAKDYYRMTIDDANSGLKVVAWIDWERKELECAVKYGKEDSKTISKPGEEDEQCVTHHEYKCHGDHVYWFDSCGNKEEKKEYCANGCSEGVCVQTECESHSEYKCDGDHVYWYNSCGVKEEKKEACDNGCKDAVCIKNEDGDVCTDSDSGKNYYEKGTATKGEQSLSDHCNDDGSLTEKYCDNGEIKAVIVTCDDEYICSNGACVASDGGCISHHEMKCFGTNYVYWYDSCGEKEEKVDFCAYGCYQGACKEEQAKCTDSDSGANYYEKGTTKAYKPGTMDYVTVEDHCEGIQIVEYQCNGIYYQELKTVCPNGCEDGICLKSS